MEIAELVEAKIQDFQVGEIFNEKFWISRLFKILLQAKIDFLNFFWPEYSKFSIYFRRINRQVPLKKINFSLYSCIHVGFQNNLLKPQNFMKNWNTLVTFRKTSNQNPGKITKVRCIYFINNHGLLSFWQNLQKTRREYNCRKDSKIGVNTTAGKFQEKKRGKFKFLTVNSTTDKTNL